MEGNSKVRNACGLENELHYLQELTSESLHQRFINSHVVVKREQELHESWQTRVYMGVSSTLMSWSNENKRCMRVDKREFTWEFHQLSCPGQTRTRVAWELTNESFINSHVGSNENKRCMRVEKLKLVYPIITSNIYIQVQEDWSGETCLRWYTMVVCSSYLVAQRPSSLRHLEVYLIPVLSLWLACVHPAGLQHWLRTRLLLSCAFRTQRTELRIEFLASTLWYLGLALYCCSEEAFAKTNLDLYLFIYYLWMSLHRESISAMLV